MKTFSILLTLCAASAQAQTLPAGYVQCALEGALCKVPAPGSIIYGSPARYLAPKPVTKDTPCTNAVFGWVDMNLKACWFKADAVVTPPAKWTLWSKPLGDFSDSTSCVAAATAAGPGSYACATTTVVVPVPPVVPPVVTGPSALVMWAAPTLNADGTPLADLAAFVISYGQAPGVYLQSIAVRDPAARSYTVGGLTTGKWYFVIQAADSTGNMSAVSAEVSKVAP